jgi:hypothetical protein
LGRFVVARGVRLGAALAAGGLVLVSGATAVLGRAEGPPARVARRTGETAFEELRKAAGEIRKHRENLAAEVRAEIRTGLTETGRAPRTIVAEEAD